MKKLTLILATAVIAMTSLSSQTVNGSFAALKTVLRARLEIDFSKALIHNMAEEQFAIYEKDWDKDMPEIIGDFVSECNERCRGTILVGNYPDAPYNIRIAVHSINTNGDWDCDAFLLDADGEELGSITGIFATGGRIGSKLNLIKDGASHTGELFGILLKRAIKKAK